MRQPLCIACELTQRAHPNRQPNWARSNTIDWGSSLLHVLSCTSIRPYFPSQLLPFGPLINHQYYSLKAATIKQPSDDFPLTFNNTECNWIPNASPSSQNFNQYPAEMKFGKFGGAIDRWQEEKHKDAEHGASRTWVCRGRFCPEQHFSSQNPFLFNSVS